MMTFDYAASAELFMPKRNGGARPTLSYRRFATAAEAIRFAVEELPAIRTLGARMQVGEERFNGDDIRRLYESASAPSPTEIGVKSVIDFVRDNRRLDELVETGQNDEPFVRN